MWLFVGLGNPGERYEETRHNFGWKVIKALASDQGLEFRSEEEALVAEWTGKAYLMLPLTFMNLSARAVVPFLTEKGIEVSKLLLVHDDLDLPLGRLKIVPKGGAGGHRGVLSVIEALGTENFPRMKLGIGRPQEKSLVKEYVLSPFSESELSVVEEVTKRAVEALKWIVSYGLLKAMTEFNK